MTTPRTPTLIDVFERARARLAEEIHTCIPCEVVSYDSAKRLASVQPLIKSRHRNEQGEEVAESLPVVNNCPCLFMGGGKFRLLFDYQKGDTVLVAFAEASIDKWTAHGGNVDPVDPRRLALSDGIVIATIRPASAPYKGDVSEGPSLAHDESNVGAHFREGFVVLGTPDASDFAALASKVDEGLTTLHNRIEALKATTFNAHTHPTAVGPSGPPIPLTTPEAAPASTAAAKVKVI